MSSNVKILTREYWREKRSTVNWVSCGSSEGWFHINGRLLDEVKAGRSNFNCSHHQVKFGFSEAHEIVRVPTG
tara:strand:+ start:346 stop:564 length:219 start_codon:yes stop_codon:yes gene_type:complete